jgi:lysophospholipase L1-like esterase
MRENDEGVSVCVFVKRDRKTRAKPRRRRIAVSLHAAHPHLFGPAILIGLAGVTLLALGWLFAGLPQTAVQDRPRLENMTPLDAAQKEGVEAILDRVVADYRANAAKLDTNLGLQAFFIVVTILLIIRRSDSLTVFDNTVPLSWLHFFVPVVLVYLWLAFGFTLHAAVVGRLRGVEFLQLLGRPTFDLEKSIFHDAGFIDGWFITYVDTEATPFGNFSGIKHSFSIGTGAFLVVIFGTLVSAAQAGALALLSIGSRRYMTSDARRGLLWYYLTPFLPFALLSASHLQFAYGGPNRNSFQTYVALVAPCLSAFLLWLAARVDAVAAPGSLHCLRRRCITHTGNLRTRDPSELSDGTAPESTRRIALIGDSLSTTFYVGRPFDSVMRAWLAWQPNWFVGRDASAGLAQRILDRLDERCVAVIDHHATVSATVDRGARRTLVDRLLARRHFSHQVKDLLQAGFPDVVLIWIGHNDVDWREHGKNSSPAALGKLADEFASRYEAQLTALIAAIENSEKQRAIIVFGLVNFEAFFRAREEAERRNGSDPMLYPHLQRCPRYFKSLDPRYRDGVTTLAGLCNQRLQELCDRLSRGLPERSGLRLVYSDAMWTAPIDTAKCLSEKDAWHPSPHGHSVLATAAARDVDRELDALGWRSPSEPGRAGRCEPSDIRRAKQPLG